MPGRSSDTAAAWFRQNPEITLDARPRSDRSTWPENGELVGRDQIEMGKVAMSVTPQRHICASQHIVDNDCFKRQTESVEDLPPSSTLR